MLIAEWRSGLAVNHEGKSQRRSLIQFLLSLFALTNDPAWDGYKTRREEEEMEAQSERASGRDKGKPRGARKKDKQSKEIV